MKCPYQTITTVETIKAMAIGNEDTQVIRQSFAECLGEECPCYVPEQHFSKGLVTQVYCRKAEQKNENI